MSQAADTATFWGYVLNDLNAPTSSNNESILNSWASGESGAPSAQNGWNPLGTELGMPNSYNMNSAGVQGYPTLAEGAAATAQTLQSNYYSGIVQNLQNDAPASAYGSGAAERGLEIWVSGPNASKPSMNDVNAVTGGSAASGTTLTSYTKNTSSGQQGFWSNISMPLPLGQTWNLPFSFGEIVAGGIVLILGLILLFSGALGIIMPGAKKAASLTPEGQAMGAM